MNIIDILSLKLPDADFTKDIILQDDGFGIYIKEWNLDCAAPSDDELESWSIELDLTYRQKLAVSKRVYPPIGDQLDMIYKDLRDGTTTFKDTIESIKLANPKPLE